MPRNKCLCGNDIDLQNFLKLSKNKPSEKEQKHIEQIMLQPYIMKIERHTTEKDVDEKKEYKTMKYYRYKFVPYIRKKNGDIIPLDPNETEPIQISPNLMETVIAVIFSSLTYNINFPMACKKTDIFSKHISHI